MMVFTDTVEYNHRVVDRITHYGQDGCNKGLVDLQRERQESGQQGEQTQYDNGIVSQSEDGTGTILPFAEPYHNVNEDH